MRGSEKGGTLLGLLPRRGKLGREPLGFVVFLLARRTRGIEFCPHRDQFARNGRCLVSLLFELVFERLLLLDRCCGSFWRFRACDPRRIEFCPQRDQLARNSRCLVSLLFEFVFERLPLLGHCGMLLELLPRRSELSGEPGRLEVLPLECPLLFDQHSLSGSPDLSASSTRCLGFRAQ